MKILLMLTLSLGLLGCEKRDVESSKSDKIVLTAANTNAADVVLDWAMRDKTKGKKILDANDPRRSQIVFPDGMKFDCVDDMIGAIITTNGETIIFQYDRIRRINEIIYPDKTGQKFDY